MRKYLLLVVAAALSLTVLLAPSALAASSSSTGSGDIVVQTVQGPTVTQKVTQRAKSSWPWYVTRGSGIAAALALVILMLSGIGQVTGYTFRFLEPLTAWASHKALGLTFGVAVLIHMLSLLFDRFVPFTILQVFVPWLSNYRPVTIAGFQLGSLYVALGVIASYLIAIITITSILWVDKKPYTWKLFHLLSYVVILLVFVHALYIGTDLAHGWLRWLWISLGIGIAVATIHRLWRAKTT